VSYPRLPNPVFTWLIPSHIPASLGPGPAGTCIVDTEEDINAIVVLCVSTALMIRIACSR